YHNSRDKRRNPVAFKYRSTPCPNVKQGDDWLEPSVCENGDLCKYCHSRTEQQFHPEIYKSSKCNDMISTGYCPRGPFCAFAHVEHELKTQRAHSTASESSSSDYTLESFMGNVLAADRCANSLSEATISAEGQSQQQSVDKMYNKPIGSERKASQTDEQTTSCSSSPSSASSPVQPKSEPLHVSQSVSPKHLVNSSGGHQEIGLLTGLNSLNGLNGLSGIAAAFSGQLAGVDYEKEKLRQDLVKQSELSNKLELLCCQYRQWVDKLTIDVNEWKAKYLRCESEKKNLECQILNKLKS
ncbi:E3 ubiquitin- ligase, partial [Brachionus plicatilis]